LHCRFWEEGRRRRPDGSCQPDKEKNPADLPGSSLCLIASCS